jgi:hypothetical protein
VPIPTLTMAALRRLCVLHCNFSVEGENECVLTPVPPPSLMRWQSLPEGGPAGLHRYLFGHRDVMAWLDGWTDECLQHTAILAPKESISVLILIPPPTLIVGSALPS